MATGSFERKSFTGGAAPTTLAGNISAGDTSITVADGSTYPTGATNPFVIVINRGTTTEEKVLITSRTNNVLTVDTRGYDDGTDQDHTLGETVEHVLDASTVDQANRYVNLQSTKGDLVGYDGTNANAVNVGTNGDVLAADSTATNGVAWTNRLTTAESEIDTLQSEMTTAQSDITTAQSDITTLQGTDIDVTLTGDVTGTATITNLGNVSITTTVGDDSHNHVIGNIDNFTEEVQDIVGGMVTSNTENGITVTYQDADGTLDFDVNDPIITLTGDVTGNATMTNLGNVSITTTVADDSHNHTTGNIDNFTENVQDIVGNMVTGNTETGLSVTYQDSDGTLDFALTKDPTITLTGDVTGSGTMTNLGNVSITTAVVDDLHSHVVSNVDGLQSVLDGKSATSHTHAYAPTSHTHSYLANSNATHNGTLTMYGASDLGVGKLHIGSPTSNGDGQIKVACTDANNTPITLDSQHGGLSGAYYMLSIYHNGVNKGSISHNGSTTSYNTTSDYRIKENIADLVDGLDVVNSLIPRRFTFKNNDTDQRVHTGFIAHELQAVMPELVIGEKDAVDEHGDIVPQVVDKQGIVAVLVSAVQNLSEKIEHLENEIALLQN